MICNNCGRQNEDGVRFCIGCGADLTAAPQPTYQAPQAPYQAPQAPYQPPYQAPYGMPVAPVVPGKGLGVASMVLGILSLVFFCVFWLSLPLSIIGLALGGAGIAKAKRVGAPCGMAVAGLVCSSIALGLALLMIILAASGSYILEEMMEEMF